MNSPTSIRAPSALPAFPESTLRNDQPALNRTFDPPKRPLRTPGTLSSNAELSRPQMRLDHEFPEVEQSNRPRAGQFPRATSPPHSPAESPRPTPGSLPTDPKQGTSRPALSLGPVLAQPPRSLPWNQVAGRRGFERHVPGWLRQGIHRVNINAWPASRLAAKAHIGEPHALASRTTLVRGESSRRSLHGHSPAVWRLTKRPSFESLPEHHRRELLGQVPLKLSQELGQLGTFALAQCAHPFRLPAMHRTANSVGNARAGLRKVHQHHPPVRRMRLPTY
jgi:hypothetical protein